MRRMSRITPDELIGAVVEEVDTYDECINCVKLRLSDGRSVDLVPSSELDADGDAWIEVL